MAGGHSPTRPHEPVVLKRRGTPRHYVLREPELPDLNHFTRRKGKAPITNKGWNPYRPFATVPLLEYGGLKPILPVLRRTTRRGAPRRDMPHAVPVDARMGINDGRCSNTPQRSPRNADCRGGAFAARRFPRPPPPFPHHP